MPEHRLVTLLQQAMAYQIDRARYRPVAQPRVFVGTLLRDYRCFAIPNACKAVYSGHEANVKAVAFAGAGGERIISGSSDCTVRVWSSEPPMAQIEEDVDGVQNIDASMDRAEREGVRACPRRVGALLFSVYERRHATYTILIHWQHEGAPGKRARTCHSTERPNIGKVLHRSLRACEPCVGCCVVSGR